MGKLLNVDSRLEKYGGMIFNAIFRKENGVPMR
jgi:hypothetical protein